MGEFEPGQGTDHAGVIGAKGTGSHAEFYFAALTGQGEGIAEAAIGADTTGGADAMDFQLFGSLDGFAYQDFHDGVLDTGAEISEPLIGFGNFGVIAQEIADGGFEAAEAEVVTGLIEERTGKIESVGIAAFCQAIHDGAARIGETEELGRFIETLASGVIQSAAQDGVFKGRLDMDQESMTAADDQGDCGLEILHINPGNRGHGIGILLNPGRVEMAFMVVDCEKGFLQDKGHGLRRLEADQEGTGQTRAAGGSDGIELARREVSIFEGLTGDNGEILEVFAGGKLRDHAAILGV